MVSHNIYLSHNTTALFIISLHIYMHLALHTFFTCFLFLLGSSLTSSPSLLSCLSASSPLFLPYSLLLSCISSFICIYTYQSACMRSGSISKIMKMSILQCENQRVVCCQRDSRYGAVKPLVIINGKRHGVKTNGATSAIIEIFRVHLSPHGVLACGFACSRCRQCEIIARITITAASASKTHFAK